METFKLTLAEFVIGLFVIPEVLFFVLTFIFVFFELDQTQGLVLIQFLEGVLILVLLFFKRRAMAFGLLLGFLWGLVGLWGVLNQGFI